MNAISARGRRRAALIAAAALFATTALVPASRVRAQDRHARERVGAAEVLPVARSAHPNLLAVAAMIVSATNEFRAEHGRDPLGVDARLVRAARYFAGYMAKTGKYGHTADGKQPAERVKQHGYDFCGVAENIAYAYSSTDFSRQGLTEEFMQGWIHSPPHRENLLNAAVTDVGIAVARSGKTGYYYAVQDFGRPHSAMVRFTVANRSSRKVTYKLDGHSYSLAPRVVRTHEVCRLPRLEISLPARGLRRSERKSFRPTAGERFTVGEDADRIVVEKR